MPVGSILSATPSIQEATGSSVKNVKTPLGENAAFLLDINVIDASTLRNVIQNRDVSLLEVANSSENILDKINSLKSDLLAAQPKYNDRGDLRALIKIDANTKQLDVQFVKENKGTLQQLLRPKVSGAEDGKTYIPLRNTNTTTIDLTKLSPTNIRNDQTQSLWQNALTNGAADTQASSPLGSVSPVTTPAQSDPTAVLLQQFRDDIADLPPLHVTDRPTGGGPGRYEHTEFDKIANKSQNSANAVGTGALREQGVKGKTAATVEFWQTLQQQTVKNGAARCLHCSSVAADAVYASANDAGLNVYLAAIPDTDHHIVLVSDQTIDLAPGEEAKFTPTEGTNVVVDLWQHALNYQANIQTEGQNRFNPNGEPISVANNWTPGKEVTAQSIAQDGRLASDLAAPFDQHLYTESYSSGNREPLTIFARYEPPVD